MKISAKMLDRALRETDVLVLDCQSTGATPELGDLLQLGWTIATADGRDEPVHAHWITPNRPVPRIVRQLTGWNEGCRASAVAPDECWSLLSLDLARVPRPAKSIIHFARFEMAFLRDLHAKNDADTFPFDAVCLHEIARRLYPHLARRSLRALAGMHGFPAERVRNSDGHVRATAFLWRALVPKLEERGVRTWADLEAWLAEPAPKRVRGTKTSYPLPAEKRKQLPSAPGIYRFVRPNGDVLYVGKAINIKKRIAGHFVSPKRKDERALEMLSQVTDIVVTTTESALEAALLEFDEIKRIDPPYNVQLRGDDERAWFATRDLLSAQPTPDDEHPIGPLPSHWSAFGLGTIRALGRGELDSERPDVRARAVSVPNAFAPDHRTFAEGWNMFVLGLARGERAPDREEEAPPAEWDPAQVHRHLDRSYWGGRLVVRRARWLQLLAESTVTYREADDVRRLTIVVPDRLGAGAWDRARYDRVRILATELMRVNAEGGDVVVEVRGHRVTRKR